MYRLTLRCFSGRPDPTWMLDDDAANTLLRIVGETIPPESIDCDLRYGGLLLEPMSDGTGRKACLLLPDAALIIGDGTAYIRVGQTYQGCTEIVTLVDGEVYANVTFGHDKLMGIELLW